jgi:hydroxymethylpyrimidine/phosphomethylpyrimidine kinase
MLASKETIEMVAKIVVKHNISSLVVDPVSLIIIYLERIQ